MFWSRMVSTVCAAILFPALSSSALSQQPTPIRFHWGSDTEGLGLTVDGGGDVDGDGVPDVISGGVQFPGNIDGTARVYSGATGAQIHEFHGSGGEHLGAAVSFVPDVNGDSCDDILLGAHGHNNGAGRVYLYSGKNRTLLATLEGQQNQALGFALAGMPNVDGHPGGEILIGMRAVLRAPEGVTLYSGGKLAQQALGAAAPNPVIIHHPRPTGAISSFGRKVAALGDMDGDGVPDYAIGADEQNSSQESVGSVRVYSGRDHIVLGGVPLMGDAHGDDFGYGIGGKGDVNGDGVADLVIGAPRHMGFSPPYVRVFVGVKSVPAPGGGVQTFTPALLYTLSEPSLGNSTRYGIAVDFIGDLDGDGADEVIVGSPSDPTPFSQSGSCRVYSGSTGGSTKYTVNAKGGEFVGESVSRLGDVNGDGVPDFLVGSHGESGAPLFLRFGNGAARVYSGGFMGPEAGVVAPFGSGCGTPRPVLTATPLLLGQIQTLKILNAPALAGGWLLIGLPVDPALQGILQFSGCQLHVNTATAIPVPVFTGLNGEATIQLPIPSTPFNVALAAQAFLFGGSAATLSATNAVGLLFGY